MLVPLPNRCSTTRPGCGIISMSGKRKLCAYYCRFCLFLSGKPNIFNPSKTSSLLRGKAIKNLRRYGNHTYSPTRDARTCGIAQESSLPGADCHQTRRGGRYYQAHRPSFLQEARHRDLPCFKYIVRELWKQSSGWGRLILHRWTDLASRFSFTIAGRQAGHLV